MGFVGGALYALLNGWSGEDTAYLAFGVAAGLGIAASLVAVLFGAKE